MTIEKLARLLVDEYFDGSPGSERAQIAVEREIKSLKENSTRTEDGHRIVQVEVEDVW